MSKSQLPGSAGWTRGVPGAKQYVSCAICTALRSAPQALACRCQRCACQQEHASALCRLVMRLVVHHAAVAHAGLKTMKFLTSCTLQGVLEGQH